jgi:subtilisin-like proprotein convertase family protein
LLVPVFLLGACLGACNSSEQVQYRSTAAQAPPVPPVPTFTVGGTVTGLAGTGLMLFTNGSSLPVAANGGFAFAVALTSGTAYSVSVTGQPVGPVQTCTVTNGSGTISASVTTVSVACVTGFSVGGVSDPLAAQQWHLKNTGQKAFADAGGVAGFDIDVDPAFAQGISGNGVVVAVVDTGLEIAHEDLAANVVPFGSFNFNTGSTDPTNTIDTTGDHGTSVAGLIAMARNGVGGLGVAPNARLKGFNFLSMTAATEQAFLNSLGASGSNPNSQDVFIFNQSFGIDATTPVLVNPTDEAQYLSGVTSLRGGKGALYVKAAGNGFQAAGAGSCGATGLTCENANFDPTNTLPYQIVVGATNASGIKASYSTAGSAIWVSAPGGEFGENASVAAGATGVLVQPAMVTTDQSGCAEGFSRTGANTSVFNNGGAPNTSCNYTNRMNGTSSATPVTVGVIALILEANPALTWRDVKHILASTARQIDAGRAPVTFTLANTVPPANNPYIAEPGWTANAAGFKFHDWYGLGMVDAGAAVNMAKTTTPGQLGTFTSTGFIASTALNLSIPDQSATGASSTLSVPATPVHFVEAVQLRVNITHPAVGELGIELVSPSGTRSVLKNILDGYFDSPNLANQVFLSNAFYGENPAGTWTIKVVDGFNFDTSNGTLANWAIRIYGH